MSGNALGEAKYSNSRGIQGQAVTGTNEVHLLAYRDYLQAGYSLQPVRTNLNRFTFVENEKNYLVSFHLS